MQIAQGDIDINLNDGDAMAGLDRVEAEFKAKMAAISRTEARAQINAETGKFDEALDRAKAKLVALKAERAEVVVGANKDDLDKKIAAVELSISRLNGRKAEVKIEVQGAEKALAQEAAIAKAESDRQKAYEQYASRRDAIIRKEQTAADKAASQLARDTASKAKAFQADERAAFKINEIKNREPLEEARRLSKVASLRKQFAEQTAKVESAQRVKPGTFSSKEIKEKVDIDVADATTKLLLLREEIKAAGGTVPVNVKVDDNLLSRAKTSIGEFFGSLETKAANIGNIRINAGPISGTLRTITAAVATLSPVITSLGGGLVSLVGVLGTGLTGAASIAGGVLTGLVLNFGGVLAAVKPVISEFTAARASTTAYTAAVQKYGAGSKQAKKAQEEMNNTLKSVSPQARDAAVGISLLSDKWKALTGSTAKTDIGNVLVNGVKAAAALMPGLAKNSNATMGILSHGIDNVLTKVRQPANVHMFDSLGQSANKFLGPAVAGLTHLGAAFLHVGSTAARIFAGPAGNGFRKWAQDIDNATQPGTKLDGEITRLGDHARDLFHLFDSVGKLLMTVFNGSADSGDRLINSMSRATDKWREFLNTGKGQKDMSDFFDRSADDVKALFSALNPLIAAFVQWSSLLAPFTTGLLQGVSFISRLVAGFTHLLGLGGPLTTLGGTIGALFAVGKIGAFVSMLAKTVSLVKELGAVGTIKALATGGLFSKAKEMSAGAASAGATIAESMEAAGTAVAAELRAAMTEGGAGAAAENGIASAAERSPGGIILPKGASAGVEDLGTGGEEAAAGIGGAAVATDGLTASLGGLAAALTPETLGVSALLGGVALLAVHFLGASDSSKKWEAQLHNGAKANDELKRSWSGLTTAMTENGSQLSSSNLDLRELHKQLGETKKGTIEHERAELNYNEALRTNNKLRAEHATADKTAETATKKDVEGLKETVSASEKLEDAQKKKVALAKLEANNAGNPGGKAKQAEEEKKLAEYAKERAYQTGQLTEAMNRQAAVSAVVARANKGLPELSKAATNAVGSLAKQTGGKTIAQTVAVKFTYSSEVAKVAAAAQRTLTAGVKPNVVLKVTADAKDANQALSSLAKIQLAAKIQHISAADGPKVVALLRSIDGIHLSAKQARIISSGGPAAVAMLDKILGIHIPDKHSNIQAHDGVSAIAAKVKSAIQAIPQIWNSAIKANVSGLGNVNALKSAIFEVQSKSVNVDAHTSRTETISKVFGPGPNAKAEGGIAQRTQGGMYNKPTLLVGEESRNEYVIATNPAYRDNNVQYLKEAANELGVNVDEAAKGKKGKIKKAAAKGKASPEDPGFKALSVPGGFSAAGVPEGPVNKVVSSIESSLTSEKSKLAGLLTSLPKSEKALTDAKNAETTAKNAKASKTKAKSVTLARQRVEKAQQKVHEEKEGISAFRNGGEYKHKSFPSIGELTREKTKAIHDKERIERANNQITHLNSVIATDQTRLGNAAGRYNASKGKDQGALTEWQNLLGSKKGTINQLLGILSEAKKTAAGVTPKNTELEKLVDELESTSAAAETNANEVVESEAAGPGAGTGSSPTEEGPPSAEKYVENLGLKGELASLNEAYALAQTNNVPDNPNTPENEELPTLNDDLLASQGLEKFWETVLSDAQASGQLPETITDIANSFTSARSTFQGLSEKVNEDTTSAATNAYNDMVGFSQARNELYENFGSNFAPVWSKPSGVTVPGTTPSLTGANGTNAVGQMSQGNTVNMNVTNHFQQPPPEPHAWSQGVAWELGAAI